MENIKFNRNIIIRMNESFIIVRKNLDNFSNVSQNLMIQNNWILNYKIFY